MLDDGTRSPCTRSCRAVSARSVATAGRSCAATQPRRCSASSPTAAWPTNRRARVVRRPVARRCWRRGRLARRTTRGRAARVQPRRIEPGMRVGVVGAGTIGLLCGAVRATWAPTSRSPRATTRNGAPRKRSGSRSTPPRDCDVVFEAAGTTSGFDDAVRACRRTGTIALVSTTWEPIPISFLNAQMREVTIVPAFVYGEAHGQREFDTAAVDLGRAPRDRARADHTPVRARRGAARVRGGGRPRRRRDQSRPAPVVVFGAGVLPPGGMRRPRRAHPSPFRPIRSGWTGSPGSRRASRRSRASSARTRPAAGARDVRLHGGHCRDGPTRRCDRAARSRRRSRRRRGRRQPTPMRADQLGHAQPGRGRLGAMGARLPHQAQHADHGGERARDERLGAGRGHEGLVQPAGDDAGRLRGRDEVQQRRREELRDVPGRHRRQRARAR